MFLALSLTVLAFSLTAAGLALPSLLKRRSRGEQMDVEREENIASARERMRGLGARADAGEIRSEQLEEYAQEIESQLLQDVGVSSLKGEQAEHVSPAHDWLGVVIVIAVLFLAPPALYLAIGQPGLLKTEQAAMESDRAPSIEELSGRLKSRLEENPNDSVALFWMGRILSADGEFASAAEHFAKARAVAGDTPELLAAEINARMLDVTADNSSEVERLLAKGLIRTPENPMLLWFAGLNADAKGNLESALGYWKRARSNLENSSENSQQLDTVIAEAEQRLLARQSGRGVGESADATKAEIVVVVDLSDALDGTPAKTLFVFAKAFGDDATPMPLAVHRQSPPSIFPLTVTLNDSLAMIPEAKMSDFTSYEVVARLSRTGNAKIASGDLYGLKDAVSAGSTVTVVIDAVAP